MPMRGYLAFHGAHWPRGVGVAELAPNVVAGPPDEFSRPAPNDQIRRLHGGIALEPYDLPTLIVSMETPGLERGHATTETDTIQRVLDFSRLALAIAFAYGPVTRFLVIESVTDGGERALRRQVGYDAWFANAKRGLPIVDPLLWATVFPRVAAVLDDWNGKHEQMAHAVWSFSNACERLDDDDRYELFCRAIETVLQTESGKSANQFAEGISLVLKDRAELPSHERLEEHYRRRNAIIHGHRFLSPKQDPDQAVIDLETVALDTCSVS